MGWPASASNLLLSGNIPAASTETVSWITSIPSLGELLSVLLFSVIRRKVGRKTLITVCICMYCATWISIMLAKSIPQLLTAVFVLGVVSGTQNMVTCIYIAEITTPSNRNLFIPLTYILNYVGIESEYLLLVSFRNYKALCVFPLLVSVIALVCVVAFTKESPYYLASKAGRLGEARRTLNWLNNAADESNYQKLMSYIEEESTDGENVFKLMLIPDNYRLLWTMLIIRSTMMFNTFVVILRTGSIIISDYSIVSSGLFVNVFGIICFLTTFVSMFAVRKVGRRMLFLIGYGASVVFHLVMSLLYFVGKISEYQVPYTPFIMVGLLLAFTLVHNLTTIPAILLLKSEVFPHNLKEINMSILKVAQSLSTFTVIRLFFVISSNFGLGCNLILYCFIASVAWLRVYTSVKETKGKTLLEIRKVYRKSSE